MRLLKLSVNRFIIETLQECCCTFPGCTGFHVPISISLFVESLKMH